MTWSKLGDENNGLVAVMVRLGCWPCVLVAAWGIQSSAAGNHACAEALHGPRSPTLSCRPPADHHACGVGCVHAHRLVSCAAPAPATVWQCPAAAPPAAEVPSGLACLPSHPDPLRLALHAPIPPPHRYLEQVMDTGVGVPRHPLFFLGRFRGGTKKGKAAGAGAETVMVSGPCLGLFRVSGIRCLQRLNGPISSSDRTKHGFTWPTQPTSHPHPPHTLICRSLWRRRMSALSGCGWRRCLRAASAPRPLSSATCTRRSRPLAAAGGWAEGLGGTGRMPWGVLPCVARYAGLPASGGIHHHTARPA